MFDWKHLDPNCSIRELKAADTLIRQIVQIIALTGENMVSHRTDLRHIAMTWNADQNALEGELFRVEDREYLMAFDIPSFSLMLKNMHDNAVTTFEMDGKNLKQALLWWEDALKEAGVRLNYLITCLPYKSESHLFETTKPVEKPADHILEEWIKTRDNATEALNYLNKSANIDAPVLTWPDKLDTVITLPIQHTNISANNNILEAGWSITDSPKPAFFIRCKDPKILNFSNQKYSDKEFEKWPGKNALILTMDKLYDSRGATMVSEFLNHIFSTITGRLQRAS